MYLLNVYHDEMHVGVLGYDAFENRYTFKYEERWKEYGFELSPHLKFDDDINSNSIRNFIENLLPEGYALEQIIKQENLSKSNFFGILNAIGIETTGALRFELPDRFDSEATSFREISVSELSERIANRADRPIAIWDQKPRISVAGVQDKLPITILGETFGFGSGSLASTHILKFSKDNHLVFNEYLSLTLAAATGLFVAHAEIRSIGDEEVLFVTRFDREYIDERHIKRLHIIDGCQALDLPVSHKYEQNLGSGRDVKEIRDGVSLKKVFSLVKLCSVPILAKKALITWVCVNLCLGNSDAHGKNISFMVSKGRFELAPFYDIVNISVYQDAYDSGLAMAIDDVFVLEELTPYDFSEFCIELEISKKLFAKEFMRVASVIQSTLNSKPIIGLAEKHHEDDFFALYKRDVLGRMERLTTVVQESVTVEVS